MRNWSVREREIRFACGPDRSRNRRPVSSTEHVRRVWCRVTFGA
jgi:hypothetical protein